MYDLNDLVQNLSTSRFTFLRTLWSNQWHLSTVSWVQKALLVIRIALRGLTIGWGQPLFIFALKWLHQYTVSLKMPNEKIRHGIACTMLHQFCTVQLSIIKSWPLQNAAKTKAVYKTRDPACGSSLRRTWKQRLKQHGCWGFWIWGNRLKLSVLRKCEHGSSLSYSAAMLLLYSASDASGQGQRRCQRCNRHQDPQCRNLFLTQVLLPQWRLEFEDFDNGNGAAWQNAFDDWVIEQFWCPQVASLQVDLQIALKKVSRCWQPKQMRGWESRQLELDHVVIWHGGGVLVQKPQL